LHEPEDWFLKEPNAHEPRNCDMTEHNCDDALKNLYVYLDKELEAATAEGIQAHLDECGQCLRSFDFERRLKTVVREHLSEEVPERFLDKLRMVINDEASSR
jgi:mycothiol system anti-sigma-R factor